MTNEMKTELDYCENFDSDERQRRDGPQNDSRFQRHDFITMPKAASPFVAGDPNVLRELYTHCRLCGYNPAKQYKDNGHGRLVAVEATRGQHER